MTTVSNPLIARLIKKFHDTTGKQKRHTDFSRRWFRDKATKDLQNVRTARLLTDKKQFKSKPQIGKLYHYVYDPKYKDTLPFYDNFPLVFIVSFAKGGWYALNMHYLPPKLRLVVFTELLRIKSEKRYRPATKLKMSWAALEKFASISFIEPAMKRYLYTHIRSKFIEIEPAAWEVVLTLPTARFKKQSKSTVWADSIRKAKRKK